MTFNGRGLAQGCQSGWRVSVGASQDEESIRLPRLVPDGWGRSSLRVGVRTYRGATRRRGRDRSSNPCRAGGLH